MQVPRGFSDLLGSERGVFSILALIAATALVGFGVLTGENWMDFVKYLVGFLVGSKTVTSAVRTVTSKPQQPPPPGPPPEARVVKE